MDQQKIGKLIANCRKEQQLTQEQLAQKLNISKNAVSKWERGINLPDVSLMLELCQILKISLNELFLGEKILEEEFKEVAEKNLFVSLENSTFTLKEKIDFFKKKWKKDHLSSIILSFISWIVLMISLYLQNVDFYLIATIASLLALLFYIIFYNRMMAYVENNAYRKNKPIK